MKKESERVLFHHYIRETKVLGPGIRSALWVSGCDKNCKGCLAKDFMGEGRHLSTTVLADLFASVQDTEGITISGGEPFLQAASLVEMIYLIKQKRDYSVIIYTGYYLDQLRNMTDSNIQKLIDVSDIIIDGPYIEEMNDGRGYRGSSNQNIIYLTERYKNSDYYNSTNREIEIVADNGFKMVGVPNSEQLGVWKSIKKRVEGCVKNEENL